ncbi:MAG: DUF4292 domain-containing protein [Bacteroidetes bacterium]|nr:DUF4292 domain-containing protein [Bacteroidota bacterium]
MSRLLLILLLSATLAACTSTSTTTTSSKVNTPAETKPTTAEDVRRVNDELCRIAGICQTLYAEGTITLRDGESSQSGQFTLRSKRANAGGDSLSMVISGPFGITAAKFLGSSNEFNFYNAIEGEHYQGRPDPKTLEKLTGMKGLSLTLLNDLVFGISPVRLTEDELTAAKTQTIDRDRSRLVICRPGENCTEAVTYRTSSTGIRLVSYQRWNGILDLSALDLRHPDLDVHYSGNTIDDSQFTLPTLIRATSGLQTLEIEYSQAKENTSGMNVKIKMPQ